MQFQVFLLILLSSTCLGKSLFEAEDEDTVVSIYTTEPTTAKTSKPFDVYHLIADNIAERITSPIYRFLGIKTNKTETTTKRTWEKLESLDDEDDAVTNSVEIPVSNDLTEERDVEELSVEALRKIDKKPEKITIYSSYLPSNSKLTENNTMNEIPDDFEEDPFEFSDEPEKPREMGFIYFLELVGSILQLAWGALVAIFKPNNSS